MTVNTMDLMQRAKNVTPGGVNSPVRSFASIGIEPIFMREGKGSYLTDLDGKSYLDFCLSWGALLLGHAYEPVIDKLQQAIQRGTSFGCVTELEVQMAELVCDSVPSIEQVRFVSSGTEAVMSAVRTARGFTGRDKIIKFEGCYHGHADYLLVKSGSGVSEVRGASSAGVPENLVKDVICIPYNDVHSLEKVIREQGSEIAAVLIEPVAGNMGLICAELDYLKALRKLTEEQGIVLIFDEVMSGFRLSLAGAQGRLGIRPDMTCLGKVIGGGLPVGAFGGKKDIMEHLAPVGDVYQAGTLSGNPLAMTAGISTLNVLRSEGIYEQLEEKVSRFYETLQDNLPQGMTLQSLGSMFTLFKTDLPKLSNFSDVMGCDMSGFAKFYQNMLKRGFYLAPSQCEANFISLAHSDEDLQKCALAVKGCVYD